MRTTTYDRRRARREAERQRNLCGETLQQFHERERPTVRLGDRLPRAKCKATGDLFSPPQPQLFDRDWNAAPAAATEAELKAAFRVAMDRSHALMTHKPASWQDELARLSDEMERLADELTRLRGQC